MTANGTAHAEYSTANPHLATQSESWGPREAPLAVVALHGRGQDPAYIRSVTERIGLGGVRFEAPAAAENQWYGQKFMDAGCLGGRELAQAVEAVDAAVERLSAAGYGRERIAVLGFSQGACLAAHWALGQERPPAALVLLTGGFIGEPGTASPSGGDWSGVPALVAGPQDDAWVPLDRMRETETALRERGAAVTALYLPPGEHTVTDAEAAAARSVLTRASDGGGIS